MIWWAVMMMLLGLHSAAQAEPPMEEPSIELIQARIESLKPSAARNRAAKKSLNYAEHMAQQAILRSNTASPDAARRARHVAWAALSLTSTHLQYHQTRMALKEAQTRAEQAKQKAQTARRALEHAIKTPPHTLTNPEPGP